MTDVFVSYSRRDSAFVRRLVDALHDRGKDVWVDVEGIRDAEVFPDALRRAVEGSDAFVFVISPDAVRSEFCELEVRRAVELNKRVVPLALRPAADAEIPEEIRVRNWIPAGEDADFGGTVERLVAALDTDLDWERRHTRLTVKSLEWEQGGRDRNTLLRGSELAKSEAWLVDGAAKEPGPTALEREYLLAGRAAATRRQRAVVGVSVAGAIISVALLIFALLSRGQAITAGNAAKSRALAAQSQTQLSVDPERSILLAMSAVRTSATNEAVFALRQALDESPLRLRLATVRLHDGFDGPGIAFSPDGRRLAVGSQHGDVVIADPADGRVLKRLRIGSLAPLLAFSPDGRQLAVTTDKDLRVLDASSGATRLIARSNVGVSVYGPDGSHLYYADGAHVFRVDLPGGDRHMLLAAGAGGVGLSGLYVVALSPDGRTLAAGGSAGVDLLDAVTGRVLATADRTRNVGDIAFAPDGSELAVASGPLNSSVLNEGEITLLDGRTLERTRSIAHVFGTTYTTMAFDPDGRRLAVGAADGSAAVYSAASARRLISLPGHTSLVWEIAFSPDGRDVVTAANDGTTLIWRVSGNQQVTIDAGGLDPSVNGNNYVMADLRLLRDRVIALFAPKRGPGYGHVVAEAWTRLGQRAGSPLVLGPARPDNTARLSLDGRRVATMAAYDGSATLRVWDDAQRRVAGTRRPAVSVGAVGPAVSSSGSEVALAGPPPSSTLDVVDLDRAGRLLKLGRTSCGVGWGYDDFSLDGRLLAATTGCGDVEIRSTTTGRPVGPPAPFGNYFNIGPVSFSSDDRRLAVANSSNDGQVSVLDIASGKIVAVLTAHTQQVQEVAFSPDRKLLATASLDGTARIWDARNGRPLRVLPHPTAVNNVAFSPDSRSIATFDATGTIRIWDACTACEDPAKLLQIAQQRVTRGLTASERRTFGVG